MKLIVYTAGNEMPDCGQCDHFDGADGFKCEQWCGPEHGEANSILKEVIEFAEKIAEKENGETGG